MAWSSLGKIIKSHYNLANDLRFNISQNTHGNKNPAEENFPSTENLLRNTEDFVAFEQEGNKHYIVRLT